MRSLTEIRGDLDHATHRRAELWRELGQGADAATRAELGELNAQIDALWNELRRVSVQQRFGDPEPILRRADRDKRLERDIDRMVAARDVARAA